MDTFMKNWSFSAYFIYQTIRRLFIWELIGSLLSICGRQKPEQKKDLYLFKVSLAFEILKQWGNAIVFRHTVQKRQWTFQFKYWRYTAKKFDDKCMHLNKLNVEIGIEYRMIFVDIVFQLCNQILNFGTRYYNSLSNSWCPLKSCSSLLIALKTKSKQRFNIQHQFQYLTPCPNDMMHSLPPSCCPE